MQGDVRDAAITLHQVVTTLAPLAADADAARQAQATTRAHAPEVEQLRAQIRELEDANEALRTELARPVGRGLLILLDQGARWLAAKPRRALGVFGLIGGGAWSIRAFISVSDATLDHGAKQILAAFADFLRGGAL